MGYKKQHVSTLCMRTVGSTYSVLSLSSTPQRQGLVDADYHLVTYVVTCLNQHIFPSCSFLPSEVGNAHTSESCLFSFISPHTVYSVPNQASSFLYMRTYQTPLIDAIICTSKSLVVRAQNLSTSHRSVSLFSL